MRGETDGKVEFTAGYTKTHIMAFPVMEFQDQGYKIRKIFA